MWFRERPVRTITVVNRCGELIAVKCASADDDLGWKELDDEESYSFSFRDNIWGTTDFWCDATYKGQKKQFNVYGGDEGNESNTIKLSDDGIYFNDNWKWGW